jgi:hypothetical protein
MADPALHKPKTESVIFEKIIMKNKFLLLTALLLAVASIGFAQTKKTKTIAPNVIVKKFVCGAKSRQGSVFSIQKSPPRRQILY